jgi:glutamyl-tRNA reductase
MQYILHETAENIFVEHGAQLEFEFQEHTARTILSLQDQFECIRREVLARYRPKLGALTIDQEEALKALTRSLANKVAQFPISEMRRAAQAKNGTDKNAERALISAVRRIFRVTDVHAKE